jgi:type VI secretion system FHA domain protein
MILTLEVTSAQTGSLKAERRKTFYEGGGTIGRSPGRIGVNHWLLPDPQVSALHALITYDKGVFYIEDRSRNGVFIGSLDNRLEVGRAYALKPDDFIIIDPYRIQVRVERAREASAENPFDVAPADSEGPARKIPPVPLTKNPDAADNASVELDPLKNLGYGHRELMVPKPPTAEELEGASFLNHNYQAPKPVARSSPAPPPIPDDWDRSVIIRPGPPPSPISPAAAEAEANREVSPRRIQRNEEIHAPAPDSVSASDGVSVARRASASRDLPSDRSMDVGLVSVLEGAGLRDVAVTNELARNFGRILRVVVAGVMDVLEARQRIKGEFRLGLTTVQPFDNNPLKFSANVDDALHNLLVKRNAAYLGPVEAFEDAFDDVRNHQMAMLAGMRVAFETMLAEFDPERLQEEFDRHLKKSARIPMPAKLLYWDLYREKIHDMVTDAETCFRELFGNEFATAYEEQLKRLKAQRRSEKALDDDAVSPDA